MPTCMTIDHPHQDHASTDAIIEHCRATGPVPPEGALVVFGGPTGSGWRMVSVWETAEAAERFVAERLAPAYAETGLSFDLAERTMLDVHRIAVGDGRGAPQPA